MAMGGGLGSLVPYQQAVTPPAQGKGVPMNQTQPMPLYPERPPNPFSNQFDSVGPDNSVPMLGREQKSDLDMISGRFSEQDKDNFLGFYDQNGPADLAPRNQFQPIALGDQFTDFMNSPEYTSTVDRLRSSYDPMRDYATADMYQSDIFPDYMGSSSRISPYEQAYRDYEARLNAPATPTQPGVQPRPGTQDYANALTLDPNYGRRPQIPRYPFMQPQPFYGGLGGFLGGGYGSPMGPMYGGFRNRFGGFPMGMMPYQQPFYQQPVMGKGFSPFRPIQPQTQPTMGKGPSDQPVVPSQEQMTPLLDEFTDFYLNEFRPKYNAPATASPYGSTLANQNLFGIGRLLSGMG